jgi:hypothetical protein
MKKGTVIPSEIQTLNQEYTAYISTLRTKWLAQNRIHSQNVYEVMRPEARDQVHDRIRQWEAYITPLAETWWQQRGYNVRWPKDSSKPMQVIKLVA